MWHFVVLNAWFVKPSQRDGGGNGNKEAESNNDSADENESSDEENSYFNGFEGV